MRAAPLKPTILALLAAGAALRSGPLAKELGVNRMTAYQALARMQEAGEIVSRKVGNESVFFGTSAAADAYMAVTAEDHAAQLRARRLAALAVANKQRASNSRNKVVQSLKPAKPAPVALLARAVPLSGETVFHPDFKRTVADPVTHDPRFQVAPGTRVSGGFASAGIGRDAMTGEAWA